MEDNVSDIYSNILSVDPQLLWNLSREVQPIHDDAQSIYATLTNGLGRLSLDRGGPIGDAFMKNYAPPSSELFNYIVTLGNLLDDTYNNLRLTAAGFDLTERQNRESIKLPGD